MGFWLQVHVCQAKSSKISHLAWIIAVVLQKFTVILAMRTITAQAALGLINRFLFGIMAIVSAYGTLLRRYTISKNMEAGRPAAFWSKAIAPVIKCFSILIAASAPEQ